MGLPMDTIHAPTVASGPRSGAATDTVKNEEKPLKDLIADKERVERELKVLQSVLDSHNATMATPLTTLDGFPRNDIDVAQIRTTRSRIIHLRNDHRDLMSRIERALHAYHASLSSREPQTVPTTSSSDRDIESSDATATETPFAKINGVVSGSPAEGAGLRVGDRIRRFGNVNWINHENLSRIAETVRRSEGVRFYLSPVMLLAFADTLKRSIQVKILRKGTNGQPDEELELWLTPRRGWGGQGLLGCHVVPV
ncbi:MAG: putative 26S proteasome regulatory subunit [Peltula sp. TS41687]|nr:MAG: putative 26S proteasome regulatory subunit [Peltula sp. TS41687]